MPVDVLADMREKRSGLLAQMRTLTELPAMSPEQRTQFKTLDGEITGLDEELDLRQKQADREARAAAARAESGNTGANAPDGEQRQRSGWSVGEEPTIYGRGSGHSYFLDMAREKLGRGDGDGGIAASSNRLRRHAQELEVEVPKRREARARAAAAAYEEAFAGGNRAERRAMARMIREGHTPFERRALNRTDGTGGYEVPPLWLIDELIPYLRAGRDFVDLWRPLPLPPGTDSINIPRLQLGSATGPQTADGGTVPGRDMQDNFVNARVVTVAGQEDVALQLLDQSPVAFDEIILGDLAADYAMQLSGQSMVGGGPGMGQLTGIWPNGAMSTASGIYVANTNNTSGQTWLNGGSSSVVNSVFQACGQLLSLGARTRMMPFTHWVFHPWIWYQLTTTVDSQLRPLVVPGTPNNMAYNQIAVDDGGPAASGPVGYYMGLPVILDPNVPTTFGGGTAPQITTISAGQTAATPGSGVYTPVVAGRWNDLFLWEGDMRTRALNEVLSGTLQVRFQLYNYVANMPNRYQAYSTVQTGSGPTTVANAGASVSVATLSQFTANGVLNMTGQGF
ncbi:phage major capsid protein [Streptacidiphilus albus]|uniref:phage major capsid protein n=1 Tax=Streptacidiphilus albus TaxID=105425 RepID=UPI00054C04E0|nr:phage major capsid protein [Streptacidiphilus albus]